MSRRSTHKQKVYDYVNDCPIKRQFYFIKKKKQLKYRLNNFVIRADNKIHFFSDTKLLQFKNIHPDVTTNEDHESKSQFQAKTVFQHI